MKLSQMGFSVTTKVFIGVTVIVLTFCLVSGYSVLRMKSIHGNLRLIEEGYLQTSLVLGEVAGDLKSFDVVLGEKDRVLLTKSVGVVQRLYPFPALVRRNLTKAAELAKRSKISAKEPDKSYLTELASQLDRLVVKSQTFEEESRAFFTMVSSGEAGAADDARKKLKSSCRELMREVRRLSIGLRYEVSRSILRSEQMENESMWAVLILSAVAIAVSITVSGVVHHTLRPIRRLTEAVKIISAGGSLRRVEINSNDEVGVLAMEFNQMIQSLEERDRQLVRSERLATIGKMAAHVAHEVRNPLSSIGLNVELLQEVLSSVIPVGGAAPGGGSGSGSGSGSDGTGDDGELLGTDVDVSEIREDAANILNSIHVEVERLAEVTESYLCLARLPGPVLGEELLEEVMADLVGLLKPELDARKIRLELRLSHREQIGVRCDENQLRQALINIIRNAMEAMEGRDADERVLTVETFRVEDGTACISISDSGMGMTEEQQERIFEAFYSTKAKGTGLGLALTQHIVEEHGGRIQVNSQLNRGTTIQIYLPAIPHESKLDELV